MTNISSTQIINLPKSPNAGDIIEGSIISKTGAAVFLDLGVFGTGIIYGRELAEVKSFLKNKEAGEKLFAKIVDLDNEDGYIELSLKQAAKEIGWETLRRKKENGETIIVRISGANKGGLLAEISGISAFLPVSQLASQNYPRVENGDKSKILKELKKLIGKEMEVKIFDIRQEENKLILSEKAGELVKLKEVLANYKVGETIEGEVSAIVGFGAFIKFWKDGTSPLPPETEAKAETEETPAQEEKKLLPTLEGLCHISELDWKIVDNPSQIVKIGEKVKAKIVGIENGRIFLSLKALKEDPWQKIEERYKKGDVVNGKIIKFNPFGVFVEITPQIYGLVHISEFGTLPKMKETIEIGQSRNFQISEINTEQHRMILKLVKETEEAKKGEGMEKEEEMKEKKEDAAPPATDSRPTAL